MFGHLKDKLKQHRDIHRAPSSHQQVPLQQSYSDEINDAGTILDCLTAGKNLTRLTFHTFYDRQHRQFCSPFNESGTVDAHHGYVVWPVSIAFWSLADLVLRYHDPQDVESLSTAFTAMEKHWSPEHTGYCAWVFFPGNNDVYYDDNAHCGNALVTAFEATGDKRYLRRAEQLTTGLISRGWDRGNTGGPGGVAWHVERHNSRNACSTLSVAVLACRLALHGVQVQYCTQLARACIEFSEGHLLDEEDGLIIDNIKLDEGSGQWMSERTKYTYNTGFAIEAFTLWSRLSGQAQYTQKAEDLASKAITPESALFDHNVAHPSKRMWWDSTYFAAHLVEALVLLAKSEPQSELAAGIKDFLARFASYCRKYLRDEHDNLYFRNLKMYRIGEQQKQVFNQVFTTSQNLEADGEEREAGDGAIEYRRLIKTLIGNASMARIYLLISDLERTVSL
jgi:rhamnogalacturonyl hydrolase YesR